MKFDKKLYTDIAKPTLVMVCICILVTLALSGTNLLTEEKIASLTKKQQEESMRSLISADEYVTGELKADGETVLYHKAKANGKTKGYIFITSAKGYGGELSVMTALDTEGTVTAVSILDASNETPGLGQNVKNADFYSQYIGQKTSDAVAVKKGTASGYNQIDAVTGATISSRAVTNAVNQAVDYAKEVLKNEK